MALSGGSQCTWSPRELGREQGRACEEATDRGLWPSSFLLKIISSKSDCHTHVRFQGALRP